MSASPLRVLLVADYDDDPRLGSAKVTHKLQAELRAAGHACDALFAGDIGARPSGRQLRQLMAPVMAARSIRRASARGPYDVIDAASAEGLWAALWRRHGRPAVVCRSNGLEHLNYQRMLDDSREGLAPKSWPRRIWYPVSRLSQVAAAARAADRLLVLNEGDRAYAERRRWQPPDRIDVVPHGVSDAYLEPLPAHLERGGGVLFCAAWDRVKGTPYLVRAMDTLAAAGHAVPLTVLGAGVPGAEVLGSFSERARRLVTVLERMPEARVMAEMRRHDLLLAPSTYEGFGLVVLEAMSQALPVVATPVGCAATLIRDGQTGVLVPPRDAQALAAAVVRLAGSPGERRRLGAAAADAVRHMSWRRTAEATVAVYRRAIAGAAA